MEPIDSLPDQISCPTDNPFLLREAKTEGIAQTLFSNLATYLRDAFYLPNLLPRASHFEYCDNHAANVSRMLKGKASEFDPTFPTLPLLSDYYTVREIPVAIGPFVTTARVIESKPEKFEKQIRLVLFTFYDNQVVREGALSAWDPKTTDEISAAPLELLRALQQYTAVDSMVCFSLGGMTLDGLKNLPPENLHLIPKTLILNRILPSIWKVASQLYPVLKWCLHPIVQLFGLDANPEGEVLAFLERASESARKQRMVIFEASRDHYFSGPNGLDSDFAARLKAANVQVDYGKFFVPLMAELAHHSCRLDWILNNPDSETDATDFLKMRDHESVAQALVRDVFATEDSKSHTCLIIGGNRDNIDSVTYLQAIPILEAFLKQEAPAFRGPDESRLSYALQPPFQEERSR